MMRRPFPSCGDTRELLEAGNGISRGREWHFQGQGRDNPDCSRTSHFDGGVGDGRAGEHEHTQVLPRLLCSGLRDPAAGQTEQSRAGSHPAAFIAPPSPQLTPVNCTLHCRCNRAGPTSPQHTPRHSSLPQKAPWLPFSLIIFNQANG